MNTSFTFPGAEIRSSDLEVSLCDLAIYTISFRFRWSLRRETELRQQERITESPWASTRGRQMAPRDQLQDQLPSSFPQLFPAAGAPLRAGDPRPGAHQLPPGVPRLQKWARVRRSMSRVAAGTASCLGAGGAGKETGAGAPGREMAPGQRIQPATGPPARALAVADRHPTSRLLRLS